MSNLKGLFGKSDNYSDKAIKISSLVTSKEILEDVESMSYVDQFIKDRQKFRSHTDYHTASNFAVYGCLEEYYDAGIDRIINTYPYDGSLKEKLEWVNQSNGFDLHLFENEYPRTNGYIVFSDSASSTTDAWGPVTSTSGAYGNPANKEYILVKGGPHVGNVYETSSLRTSNLEINGRNGNTIEFWLKKNEYVTSKTQREVIFDISTTSSAQGSSGYGRLTVELDSGTSSKSPFVITYQSGSTGFKEVRVGQSQLYASASDGNWHHYAITLKNTSNQVRTSIYIDGEINKTIVTGSSVGSINTALFGTIGALSSGKDSNFVTRTASESFIPGLGYGKLSGSLDEFRYWKKERSSKDIRRFWFTQVGGGTNTDPANTPLGFYFKFNEGETGLASIDKTVLDYSGRVSNGLWVGYTGYGRTNNSAIVESSASINEFKDPILYHNHPQVKSFRESSLEKGYAYDLQNASGMYYSFPNWIVDEDGEFSGDLKKITQIIASYFDSLFLQIKDLKDLRHVKYSDFKNKPYPFNQTRLESMGLVTPELFMDASILNALANRDEDKNFEQSVADVKNFIYNNIYNNLESIFKSKGTEKSFRNLFRCFGVDSELIKINLYSDDSTYPIENSYAPASVKNKYVSFYGVNNRNATVVQTIDGLVNDYRASDSRGYVTGSEGLLEDGDAIAMGMTAEAQVFIPKLFPLNHPFYFDTDISASVFGCHSVKKNLAGKNGTSLEWTSTSDDHSNFQVKIVKENAFSKTAKFVLTNRNNIFDPLETDFIVDLYDSNRWNLAVRLVSDSPVTGSSDHRIEFYGVNVISDEVNQKFSLSRGMTSTKAANFIKNSRRFYVGAERQDSIGTIVASSDVKVTNFRVWNTSLNNDEINSHAFDPRSYGLHEPSRLSFPTLNVGNQQIPRIDLLTINWDFNDLTGSNKNGEMWITDVSSGSAGSEIDFGKLSPIIGKMHPAKGFSFPVSTTGSVDVEYDQAVRLQPFENVRSSDMVQIQTNDDITFTRETKPKDYFFSFEKSMYDAISDEMLSFFAGVKDFSNLIGAPVERYRPSYKALSKLKQVFFDRIENSPDIERYTEYYKWLDSSLSVMIDQLVPLSVNASEDIRNMIQSHILERNKYHNKFPTIEFKQSDPVGQIRGVNELLYDWEHGHAPIGRDDSILSSNTNCLWKKERAQRATDILVTGSSETDSDREIVRRVINTSVSGTTYATRRLSKPYRLSIEGQRHAKGGDNTFGNKKKRFYTGVSTAHGLSHISVTGSDAIPDPCKDIINPSEKKKLHAAADIAFTDNKDRDINDIAPFSLYSSSIDAVTDYHASIFTNFKKGAEITNLHADEYGDDREVTLQSPFTERWVGGNVHRHQDLSGSFLGNIESKKQGRDRVEAFKIVAKDSKLYVLPPNASGLNAGNLPIIDHTLQTSQLLRDGLAKRPVNIRNISSTTGSISLGNYNHIYDVVQYTTEDQRKDFVVDNLEQMTSSNSTVIRGVKEFSKFARPIRKTVFKARFSSPGGTEVSGDSRGGHSIDRETNQYSVYNSLNYRNLSVRGPRDFLDSIPQTGSKDSNSLVTDHKINANPRYKISGSDPHIPSVSKDNRFVQHQIPRNDYQYSWFTASLDDQVDVAEIPGHLHSFNQSYLGGNTTGSLKYEKTYQFVSGNFGRFGRPLPFLGQEFYNLNFVGLNVPGVNVQDHLTSSINTVASSHLHGFISGTINYRQGVYGWPSWKQTRVGDSALGRFFRKNNLYSFPSVRSGDGFAIDFKTQGNYSWPDNTIHRTSEQNRDISRPQYRFTDPPVSSNRHPISLKTFYSNVSYINFDRQTTEINYPANNAPAIPRFRVPSTQDLVDATQSAFERVRSATSFRPGIKKYTFNNNLTQFANDTITKVLEINNSDIFEEQNLLRNELLTHDFTVPGSSADYSIEIFPKEKNAYLERTRERTRFETNDFWKTERSKRTLVSASNSQGNIINELSMWPLDGPKRFSSEAIKRTTDKLGDDGSGELFANYSVFHNNLTHPSASALYARPFPVQATSSLKSDKTMFRFYLAHTINRKAQIFNDFTVDATKQLSRLGNKGILLKLAKPNSNATDIVGANKVPHGYVNDASSSFSDGTVNGTRLHNLSGGDVLPIAFKGTRTAAASITDNPGPYTHYRFVSTTGSVLSNRGLLINFHLRTGTSFGSNDTFGITRSSLPMYVEVGSDANGWTTVSKIEPEARHITAGFAFHSVLVTASFAFAPEVRWIAPTTDSDTAGNWNLILPTIYECNVQETFPLYAEKNNEFVGVNIGTPSSSFAVANRFSLKRDYFTPQSDFGFLSFAGIDEYGDEVSQNFDGLAQTSTSTYFSSDISIESNKTFDIQLRQIPESSSVLVYQKNNLVDNHLYGSQFFRTPELSGRNPFNFNNYEDFAYQSKLLAKDYGLVPEFRISEHMDRYINEVGGPDPFFSCNDTMFTLTGSKTLQNSADESFFEIYSHTDFIKHFNVVESRMESVKQVSPTKLSLECKAFKKFLPYKGFYPADRMTQLATEFSSSYNQFVTGGHWRNVLAPYYAPGIGFNTIKSGIAVDYPIFEPQEDRVYNKYGVIFQSASLAFDHDGTAINPKKGRPYVAGEVGSGVSGKLSTNRIEIGGGSDWAKMFTGSLAPSETNNKIVISCWMYFPKKHEIQDSFGSSVNSYGLFRQKGCIASFGSGEDSNTSAWKKGVHFGFWTQVHANSSTSNALGAPLSGLDAVDPRYNIGFTCFGGDGKDFFALSTHGGSNSVVPTKSVGPGWNHILLSLDPNGIGYSADGGSFVGFESYVNADTWSSVAHLTASSGFYDGGLTNPDNIASGLVTNSGSAKTKPKLDGHRNCFIGNHLGNVNRLNAGSLSLNPTSYAQNATKTTITFPDDPANTRSRDQMLASEPEHTMLDWLTPAEYMMSEIVILNSGKCGLGTTSQLARALSGYVNGPPNFNSAVRSVDDEVDNLIVFPTVGDKTLGPRNPYVCLPKSGHKNIIGWYRPGNDTGYVRPGQMNGMHVFNHAQNLFSGEIIGGTTGSVQHYDVHGLPMKYNHLSGTFYGFTHWSGSVSRDLKFTPKHRQRWNGIADLTNPAQYTYVYHFPSASLANNADAPFKTWYANIGDNTWFDNARQYTDKRLLLNNENISGSYMTCTGSIRIPSFIVGTGHNFTEDSSVPRIGSASYGTYHFTGSSAPGAEPMFSAGWINDDQKNTGVRKVSRVPFEAIIEPALFTPETKDDGDVPSALFYDMEPHPSASLLGAMTNKRRYTGQNNQGDQVFTWTDRDQSVSNLFPTDKNFHFGISINSSSVMSEFDLAGARQRQTTYSLAANNFYAESLNFFIANKKGVTIRSKSRLTHPVDIKKGSYRMTIQLDSGRNPRINVDNPMYNNPSAFGIPIDAGTFRKQHLDGTYFSKSLDQHGYGFAPYLPSHYDGFSRAVYTFEPDTSIMYTTIEQVLEDTTVEYYRTISGTGSVARRASGFASNERSSANSVVSSYNRRFAMHITESFNGMSLDDQSNLVQRYGPNGEPIEGEKSLVIQTKFECPTFDFSTVSANKPRTSKSIQHLSKIKGVWHQTGSFGTESKRPSVSIISPKPSTDVGDLRALLGMQIEQDQNVVGEMPESRTIREGVVAVPFRTENNVRKFFNLPPHEVYQAVRNLGYSDYKLKTEEERREFEEFANLLDDPFGAEGGGVARAVARANSSRRVLNDQPSVPIVRPSIQNMVKSMMHYNMPPQFNFLKYNNQRGKYIKPFAMYIFDFSVSLNKDDIARIWQNMTPDIGLDNFGSRNGSREVLASSVVEHDLFDVNDLLNPLPDIYSLPDNSGTYGVRNWTGGFRKDLQWMVFKVKQKAEASYFRKKELDLLPDGHPEKTISVEDDIFRYGFNWPYDYFSLVELVNLKSTVSFSDKDYRYNEETAEKLYVRRFDD